ncbi:MAM domain-containing glycosylphosphatidylinositol anchor protein 2-like [Mytilus galloprovincialis]|uniref:MAM domain-containing glycosylphosphatidylinositol anchor protein 2-like n=1 Tax=Mytilus galloprovincialis TaxID=29158 RepID=UPI003F7C591F
MMKFCCLIVIILCTIYVTNGGILTGQCLASNGKCGTKGLTCEQKFGQGWINKGRCCNEKPCCGEEESTVKPEISYSCGFETTEQCFFKQVSWDDFDWTRGSGSTPTNGTGPRSAAEGIHYMFIEATGEFAEADLDTNSTSFQASPYCLSFQYHMNGPDIGTLQVYAGEKSSFLSNVWKKTGPQPNPDSWKTATINIPQYSNLRIIIEATRKAGDQDDISIDDIILKSGTCTNN